MINLLIEGILDKNKHLDMYNGLDGIRADEEEYELFFNQFLDSFEVNVYNNILPNKRDEIANFIVKAKKSETMKGRDYFKKMEEYLRDNNRVISQIAEKFLRWGLGINFQLGYGKRDLTEYIRGGGYYPSEHMIDVEIDIGKLFYTFHTSDPRDKKYLNQFLEIIEHELVHAVQYIKHDMKDIRLGTYHKKKNKKGKPSSQRYIGLPTEIPAQAKSLASMYYLAHNKNASKAIDALRKLEEPVDMNGTQKTRWDYIKQQLNNPKNKKVRTLLKYAFLYLNIEKIEQEGLE